MQDCEMWKKMSILKTGWGKAGSKLACLEALQWVHIIQNPEKYNYMCKRPFLKITWLSKATMPLDFQEIIFRVYFIINTYKIFKIEFYIVSSFSTVSLYRNLYPAKKNALYHSNSSVSTPTQVRKSICKINEYSGIFWGACWNKSLHLFCKILKVRVQCFFETFLWLG